MENKIKLPILKNKNEVTKLYCPKCGNEIDGYDESVNFYYTTCKKCNTKIRNINYLEETER